MTDDDEKRLSQDLLAADLQLRSKQVVWETPRNIALIAGAVAAFSAAAGGFFGFKLAQSPAPAPIVITLPGPQK